MALWRGTFGSKVARLCDQLTTQSRRAAGPKYVEHLLMGEEELVGEDARMAATPERLSAGRNAAPLPSQGSQAFLSRAL